MSRSSIVAVVHHSAPAPRDRDWALERAAAPVLEALEGRRLLAFTATVSGSTATLTGSAGNDVLAISVVNGTFRHSRFGAGDAGFTSNADFDTATPGVQTLSATGTTLTVNTGDGDDVVTVGRTFSPIAATVNLDLGAGTRDVAYLLDDATTTNQTYRFDTGRLARGAAVIGIANVETVEFKAGTANDGILVAGSAATFLAINANGGNDSIWLGNTAGSMDAITGNIAAGGGVGTDKLRLQNATGTATGLNFAAGVIFRAVTPAVGVDDVTYGSVETITVVARGTFVLRAINAPTNLTGGSGRDTFDFGPNADLRGGAVNGGDGSDTLRFASRTTAVNVNLATGRSTAMGSVRSIEAVIGGAGHDVLIGGGGHDSLYGGAGNDLITGNGGNDTLIGASGADTLNGVAGNDLLSGGGSADSLQGGDGDDQIFGGDGNDVLRGHAGHDRLFGELGNDLLDAGIGNDSLTGGSGADTLIGGDGTDSADNDLLDRRSGIEVFV